MISPLRCIILLLVCCSVFAHGNERTTLSGAYIEFPPLSYTSDEGMPTGEFIELANQLAAKASYRIEWEPLPIDRIYLYLEQGDLDVWAGSSAVPALADFTTEPDFRPVTIELSAFYDPERTPTPHQLSDIKGSNIILIRGYTYLGTIDPLQNDESTRIGRAPDHRAALEMLQAGRGDFLINFNRPMETAIREKDAPPLQHFPITAWDTTLVFSHETANLVEVIEAFEKAWEHHSSDVSH